MSFRRQELLSCAGKVKKKVTVILSQLLHQQSRPPNTAFDPSLLQRSFTVSDTSILKLHWVGFLYYQPRSRAAINNESLEIQLTFFKNHNSVKFILENNKPNKTFVCFSTWFMSTVFTAGATTPSPYCKLHLFISENMKYGQH